RVAVPSGRMTLDGGASHLTWHALHSVTVRSRRRHRTDAAMQPVLFLSHSGIDTEAARKLKQRLEAAPDARARGLTVWVDKEHLQPGDRWQAAIEGAIQQSTAFAVLVGSRGVVNWVEAEVRLGLDRATASPGYRFIPIFVSDGIGPEVLPGFARQYHALGNVD